MIVGAAYRNCVSTPLVSPLCSTTRDIQILFLNKIDLFAEKLPISPLANYFPDYNGGPE